MSLKNSIVFDFNKIKIRGKCFIIINTFLYNNYYNYLSNLFNNYITEYVIFDIEEKNKTIESYFFLIDILLIKNINKSDYIISVGGGAQEDVSSFVASTLLRGINLILIPTTLLAMVDSSIGGKNGINYNERKNLLGTIYLPKYVYIDTIFLKSLSKEIYLSGFGEIIKYALLSKKIYKYMINNNFQINKLIKLCIYEKLKYIKNDLFDNNKRMYLNYGHTFGHIIELKENISHGLSVLCGIYMVSCYVYDKFNIKTDKVIEKLNILTKLLGIKYQKFDYKNYEQYLFLDKKVRFNNLNLVVVSNKDKFLMEIEKCIK